MPADMDPLFTGRSGVGGTVGMFSGGGVWQNWSPKKMSFIDFFFVENIFNQIILVKSLVLLLRSNLYRRLKCLTTLSLHNQSVSQMTTLMQNKDKNLVNIDAYAHVNPLTKRSCVLTC